MHLAATNEAEQRNEDPTAIAAQAGVSTSSVPAQAASTGTGANILGNFTAHGTLTSITSNTVATAPNVNNTTETPNATVVEPATNEAVPDAPMERILYHDEEPPLPPLICEGTSLSSEVFCGAYFFQVHCGKMCMPRPLNVIARIITYHTNKKQGTTGHRIAEVDLGDNQRTKLLVDYGSVLYQISTTYNPLPEGSYAALYDVEDVKRGSGPTLRFKIKSSAARLTDFDDAKWEAVKRWNARMKERTKARLLE